MGELIYKTLIKAWGSKDSDTITLVTEPEHGFSMRHHITTKEWSIIEAILESLAHAPNPVPYIIHEVSGYSKEIGV